MKEFFKSIAALSVALVAVACSESEEVAGTKEYSAIEGVPMSISLNAGTSSRVVCNGLVTTPEAAKPGQKVNWKWQSGDEIFAINKTKGIYAGRLVLVSGGGQEDAVFRTPAEEGLKVQDGDSLVFWYLGRKVDLWEPSTAIDEYGSKDKVYEAFGDHVADIKDMSSDCRLKVDLSKQVCSQWGTREIMSTKDKAKVIVEGGKKMAYSYDDKKLVMNHHTSFAPVRFRPDYDGVDYTINNNFEVWRAKVENVYKSGTLNLLKEKWELTASDKGTVEFVNNANAGVMTTTEFTIIPGVQDPKWIVQSQLDAIYESQQVEFDCPEAYYVVDEDSENKLGSMRWNIMCSLADEQPNKVTGRGTGQAGGHHQNAFTTGNLVYSYGWPKYRYGFQLAEEFAETSWSGRYCAFPFLTSLKAKSASNEDPAGGPYTGPYANEIMYGDASLDVTSWTDLKDEGAFAYDFNYPYNLGIQYKNNNKNGYSKDSKPVWGTKLYASYAVPTIGDFDISLNQQLCAYAKFTDIVDGEEVEFEGVIITSLVIKEDNFEGRAYCASRLGVPEQASKFKNRVGHFASTPDSQGRYMGALWFSPEDYITGLTIEKIKKSHFAFLPINKVGYSTFQKTYDTKWKNLGVYQTSQFIDGAPTALFFGKDRNADGSVKEDSKVTFWMGKIEPTDFTFVRFLTVPPTDSSKNIYLK